MSNEREATYAQLHRLAQAHAILRAIEQVTPMIVRGVLTKIPRTVLMQALALALGPDGHIHPAAEDYAAARRDASALP